MAIGLITFGSSSWTYDTHYPDEQSLDVTGNKTFPVAYSGSTYYSTIDAAFYDHRAGSDNPKASESATIVVLPTDTIISNNGLTRNKKTFEAIYKAKTLNSSVSLGSNKKIIVSYKDSTSTSESDICPKTSYANQADFGDSSAEKMATNLKNFITIGQNVTLTIPSSSYLYIAGYMGNYNTGLVSGPTSQYGQITLEENASIVNNGSLYCYGFIKETYEASGTTSVYLTGTSSKTATLYVPTSVYHAVGGTVSTACNSSKVFPYNVFSLVNIQSTIHCNYYSAINMHFKFEATSYGTTVDAKANIIGNSSAIFLMKSQSIEVTLKHDENKYLEESELEYGTSGSSNYMLLQKVSKSLRDNKNRRTYIDIKNGNAEVGSINLNLYASLKIDTSQFYLPLNYEYRVVIHDGCKFTNNYRVCFLPGSTFTIKPGATAEFSNHTLFLAKRKNDAGKTLIGPTGVGTYPYLVKNEDSLDEIKRESENAKLYNAGTLIVKKGFGGKIYCYDETFAENNESRIEVADTFIDIGKSTATHSTTCPRYYSVINTASDTSQDFDYFESFAYIKLYDGENLSYKYLSSGTYVPYRRDVNEDENIEEWEYGWVATSAAIHFETNGAHEEYSDVEITITSNGYDISVNDLPDVEPTKDYYTFKGWYIDSDCLNIVDEDHSYKTYTGVTIYAKWEAISFDIVYHFNKDSEDNDLELTNPINNNPESFNADSNFNLTNIESEDGFTFDGWYLNSNYSGMISIINSSLIQNLSNDGKLHLYARWYTNPVEVWTISFEKNNDDEEIVCVDYVEIISENISQLSLPDLGAHNHDENYGKYFAGWCLDEELTNPYSSYTQITGSQTLYAKWNEKNEISIEVLGTKVATKYLNKDVTFTIPSLASHGIPSDIVPEKTGYDVKWIITNGPASGGAYSEGEVITLTDKWGEQITVDYNYVAQTFTLSITTGKQQTTTVTVTHLDSTNESKTFDNTTSGKTGTMTVKTGETISVSVAKKGNYTEGGGVTVTNLTSSNGKYTVNGKGAPSITVADCTEPSSGTCVAKGTLVMIPDGSSVPVETLNEGDLVMAYDHVSGEMVASPIMVMFHLDEAEYTVTNLWFENGIKVEVISGHCFLSRETLKYEEIREENVESYLGQHFYHVDDQGIGEWLELTDYSFEKKITEVYSFSTYKTLNHFVEGMLAYADDFIGLNNYFEMNEDLKYDEEKMMADIEQYGLYSYDEWIFSEYVTEEVFEAFNGAYLKVAVGKGLLTEETLIGYMKWIKEKIEQNLYT